MYLIYDANHKYTSWQCTVKQIIYRAINVVLLLYKYKLPFPVFRPIHHLIYDPLACIRIINIFFIDGTCTLRTVSRNDLFGEVPVRFIITSQKKKTRINKIVK